MSSSTSFNLSIRLLVILRFMANRIGDLEFEETPHTRGEWEARKGHTCLGEWRFCQQKG